MATQLNLDDCLVIGISSRALFDLELENQIFEEQGVQAYSDYQREHEDVVLNPGTAFPLVQGLLSLNEKLPAGRRAVEVVVMSRNSADLSLRIFNSIEHHGLDISRAAFTRGRSLADYLEAFSIDLFLSRSAPDVQNAIDAGFAAAQIYNPPDEAATPSTEMIRIAFDADAVIFSEESERIFKEQGIDAFVTHERDNARLPLNAGPFARLLMSLSLLQRQFDSENSPIRIAIVTARNSPAHERIVRTLREWGVRIDEAFFLGGVPKDSVLKAFGAHIFFDDQERYLDTASKVVAAGHVPYRSDSPLHGQGGQSNEKAAGG